MVPCTHHILSDVGGCSISVALSTSAPHSGPDAVVLPTCLPCRTYCNDLGHCIIFIKPQKEFIFLAETTLYFGFL